MREKPLDEMPGWGGQSPGQRLCVGVGEDIYKEPLGPQTETQALSSGQGRARRPRAGPQTTAVGEPTETAGAMQVPLVRATRHVQASPTAGTAGSQTVRSVLANELRGQDRRRPPLGRRKASGPPPHRP